MKNVAQRMNKLYEGSIDWLFVALVFESTSPSELPPFFGFYLNLIKGPTTGEEIQARERIPDPWGGGWRTCKCRRHQKGGAFSDQMGLLKDCSTRKALCIIMSIFKPFLKPTLEVRGTCILICPPLIAHSNKLRRTRNRA